MERKHTFLPGEFYHVYNRGNTKQIIFLDDHDRERFVKLLYLSNSTRDVNFRDDIVRKNIEVWDFDRGEQLVSIGAWVLMPNHFHVYLSPRGPQKTTGKKFNEEETVGLFMKKLLTSYAKYFNKRHERTGVLFEGPFRSIHVETDEYAKYLFSYIHLNPVKLIDREWKEKGIRDKDRTIDFLEKYVWSSYLDHKGIDRVESQIISTKNFPGYFVEFIDFDTEIMDWLSFGTGTL